MDALCSSGELASKFWDPNLTLHTDNPDLTPCFQNSLLAWAPCIYLWASLPCYLLYLRRRNQGYIILSGLCRLKTLLATLLIQYERLRGVRSSGILIIFWFLSCVCAIVPFRSKILIALEEGEVKDTFRFTTFYIYFALIVFSLILSCAKDKPPFFSPSVNVNLNSCPEANAGFLSRLTFWWFTKMAILGYRRPLEEKDLWSLNEEDSSRVLVLRLLKEWEKQRVQAKQ
ncbi:canalicular multispecific organic anion transporter 2 isoform X2 [Vombatus ursinus]|uniref:canalicular multispecific organic anion transporter 2 isoform X2 n=1 Tax=Vombatus ursinus TaxID=29139 RepID=UPI000FFD8B92|nr:canalicular multispecific organic anion transporter 2 isoform X2 [Vombatus ursinus]